MELYNRYIAIQTRDQGVPAFHNLVPGISNPAKYVLNLIRNDPEAATALINQLEIDDAILASQVINNQYLENRKLERELQGLTEKAWFELQVENDASGMATFRSKWDAINVQFPKP